MGTSRGIIKILLAGLVLASLLLFTFVVTELFRLSFSAGAAEVLEEAPELTLPPAPTPKPVPGDVQQMLGYVPYAADEIAGRPGMFGRLFFPDAGISVALFTDGPGETLAEKRQGICDAEDSAALYYDEEGAVIADHNNQAFAGLINVLAGQKAYIVTADSVLELVCSQLIDGHNNDHKGIVDADYAPLRSVGDFICYTCKENWLDVRIVVLELLGEYTI